ncbi:MULTISPECIES: hypothetical protein [Mycobacteroides]|uniref:hypothetical protein n=1 Tax=Mycobacteroides TaxID=670516 RepID=UPI000927651B|nr:MULTISPECIES: hypothetical protein [Mycobacteroides]MBV6360488.1 hypothetical protein [Mycobacteroides chelonae]SHW94602.1 Uncharacterised protein [Mycobacteroides abscessus subsp. abscessus]SKL78760.1 Uncharacterised protein [Mycobacteroides abscessus subsp. abscessus]SKM54248.1 Uncharacterised protein [Mycobacteroides abscessus subsp. abscessus]SLK35197.1 Uncharacterised protein [Mycobacteroides abscessus subsp. abscessus]
MSGRMFDGVALPVTETYLGPTVALGDGKFITILRHNDGSLHAFLQDQEQMLHMAEQFDAEVVDERLAEMEKVLKGGDPTLER